MTRTLLLLALAGCNSYVPGIPLVEVQPSSPTTEDDLHAVLTSPAEDADGNAIVYAYQWSRDGVPVDGMAGPVVPAAQTQRGERWSVRVHALDGSHRGEPVVAEVEVQNAVPAAWARVSPTDPTTADTLYCQTASVDADGDALSWSYAWYVNDQAVSSEETLTYAHFAAGDDVRCVAVADDGTDESEPAGSTAVTPRNGPPIITIRFDSEVPKTETVLGVRIDVVEPDGDSRYHEHTWLVDDQPLVHAGYSLDGAEWFDRDQVVSVVVSALDGHGNQSTQRADVTVVNTPPEAPELSITPAGARQGDDLQCVVGNASKADADGDRVNYVFTWTLDGVETTAGSTGTYVGDSVVADYVGTGDEWACSAMAFDGQDYGEEAVATVGPIGVSNLPDTRDSLLYGNLQGDGLGKAVAGVGDVNGDGFDDLLAGAPDAEVAGLDIGSAYLFLGPIEGSYGATYADFELLGGGTGGEATGGTLAGIGDLNQDGYDDFAVSAVGFDGGGPELTTEDSGVVYLFYGPVTGLAVMAEADALLFGEIAGDRSGQAVAGLGDFNPGGLLELAVGAPGSDHRGESAGKVYLLTGPLTGTVRLGEVATQLYGAAAGDFAGDAVDCAGDVDGDGTPDLLVGANGDTEGGTPNAGAAFLFFGPLTSERELRFADVKLVGEAAEDFAGAWVSGDLDLDGDGYADVAVGANREHTNGVDAGAVYLVHGPVSGTESLAHADVKLLGEAAGDKAGLVVDGIGDLDGDGLDELIITAPYADDVERDAGAVYLVTAAELEAGTMELGDAVQKLVGAAPEHYVGWSASAAGDIDGDGLPDVAVGAPGEAHGGTAAGGVFLLLGESLR
jgi:hypothetical protein